MVFFFAFFSVALADSVTMDRSRTGRKIFLSRLGRFSSIRHAFGLFLRSLAREDQKHGSRIVSLFPSASRKFPDLHDPKRLRRKIIGFSSSRAIFAVTVKGVTRRIFAAY
jgi:hypothetical protein